jgi:hypothetical protein
MELDFMEPAAYSGMVLRFPLPPLSPGNPSPHSRTHRHPMPKSLSATSSDTPSRLCHHKNAADEFPSRPCGFLPCPRGHRNHPAWCYEPRVSIFPTPLFSLARLSLHSWRSDRPPHSRPVFRKAFCFKHHSPCYPYAPRWIPALQDRTSGP